MQQDLMQSRHPWSSETT